jgi:hypothetical protein
MTGVRNGTSAALISLSPAFARPYCLDRAMDFRQRVVLVGTIAALMGSGLTGPAIGAAISRSHHQTPVLGFKNFEVNGRGWGTAHPKRIFNGGDPSGLVNHLRWSHWGRGKAFAVGKTYTYKPHGGYYGREVKDRLRASDLGRCHHKLAYKRLYYRVQTKPGGRIQKHWHPWATKRGNVCRPIP